MLSASRVFDHPGIKDLNIEGGGFFQANDIQSDFCVYIRHWGDSHGTVLARQTVKQAYQPRKEKLVCSLPA